MSIRQIASWVRHPHGVRADDRAQATASVCVCERSQPAPVYLWGSIRLQDAWECLRCGRPCPAVTYPHQDTIDCLCPYCTAWRARKART